jgi:hypothetical protein
MNQFFLESRGKEKVNDLLKEGQQSQAFHRSGAPTVNPLRGLPKFIIGLLGILGLLAMLLR